MKNVFKTIGLSIMLGVAWVLNIIALPLAIVATGVILAACKIHAKWGIETPVYWIMCSMFNDGVDDIEEAYADLTGDNFGKDDENDNDLSVYG